MEFHRRLLQDISNLTEDFSKNMNESEVMDKEENDLFYPDLFTDQQRKSGAMLLHIIGDLFFINYFIISKQKSLIVRKSACSRANDYRPLVVYFCLPISLLRDRENAEPVR